MVRIVNNFRTLSGNPAFMRVCGRWPFACFLSTTALKVIHSKVKESHFAQTRRDDEAPGEAPLALVSKSVRCRARKPSAGNVGNLPSSRGRTVRGWGGLYGYE